jgi:hypothetical protein
MNRLPTLFSVPIAALAFSATIATAWAQPKPAGTTGAGAPSGSSPQTPSGTSGSSGAGSSGSPTASPTAAPTGSAGASGGSGATSATGGASSAPGGASARPAAALPKGTPDELFRRGNELAKLDQWAEAEPFYRAAWEQKKSYDIAGNLGLAEFQQRKWRDAAEHLSFAVKSFPASGKAANRTLLESVFDQVKAEVGAVAVTISMPGAEVSVDGVKVGVSPLSDTVFVDPGARKIEATLQGYEPATRTITATKGSSQELTLTLVPKKEAPKPESFGWRPTRVHLIAGGAAAVVGLGAGIAFTAVANGKASDAAAMRGDLTGPYGCYATTGPTASKCDELTSTLKSQSTFGNLAVAGFVIGGVAALGTAGLAAWTFLVPAEPKADSATGSAMSTARSTARMVPVVDASTRGVAVVGRW